MLVSCIQTNPKENVTENLKDIESHISSSAKNGAQVVLIPEMFSYMGNEEGRLASADNLSGGIFSQLNAFAKEHQIFLVAGSHAEVSNTKNKVFNTSVTYSPIGEALSVYRKIHLFNLKDATGNPLYCESDVFAPGTEVSPFEIVIGSEKWKCLTLICYDLRFPELFRKVDKEDTPYDVIFLPAAFTHQTGRDHWEALLRARAIENQCYIVACNQTGSYAGGAKRNYGHSMIVDPWGKVVASMEEEVDTLLFKLSKEEINLARIKLPALSNRIFY